MVVIEGLARIGDAVTACGEAAMWALPDDQLVAAVAAVHGLDQRLAAVKPGLIREIDGRGLAVGQGASSTGVWLRDRLRIAGPAARRLVELAAAAVDAGPPVIGQALACGAVTVDQARVIARAVAGLPAQVGDQVAGKAAQLLVDWAAEVDPPVLRRLGERITTPPTGPRPPSWPRWRPRRRGPPTAGTSPCPSTPAGRCG
jgi:hypothetical protein